MTRAAETVDAIFYAWMHEKPETYAVDKATEELLKNAFTAGFLHGHVPSLKPEEPHCFFCGKPSEVRCCDKCYEEVKDYRF